ncbi:hypothetical protein PV682_21095 [Streptomyces niveiscabiei]|uniref:DUF6745 domain-containing protein n=1 Tax=Streptomyces niveiscabiei TaxID=164115 RepID=UPI0029AC64FA|nr:hypothetical protein [Streptomyces niveiscabiei]MDX3383937.1 hypothetical protein [Streptomyces niveiscabiei]
MNVNEWRACAASAVPADRERAEAGVRLAYRRAGLAGPERILWAGSPLEGVAVVGSLTDPGASVREAVRSEPWAVERRRLHAELGPEGWSAHWSATGGRLWELTQSLVDRIRDGVLEEVGRERAGRARLILLDALLGQHDAPWLAAFAGGVTGATEEAGGAPRREGAGAAGATAPAEHRSEAERPAAEGPLDGLVEVCRSAGWWWAFEKVAVVCERPVELHRDEAGRLDRGDGPALAFPDGFALCAWRGMPVPPGFLDELRTLVPQRIQAEENAELRRVMLEFYGYERYLADSGARPVHRDQTGVLWRIEMGIDEPVVMVEVVNSTPEPDGSRNVYWLRVPPGTRTAREGVAWTFGLSADAYAPLQET